MVTVLGGGGGVEIKGKGNCRSAFEGFVLNQRLFSPLCLH